MKIALTGNPNSGKTTLYNAITGSNEHVGNWAGVTVDKKEGTLKNEFSVGEKVTIVDLPGAYSMSPFTSEESITSEFVKNEKPDVLINIVDATNLSRSLFFTTQLLELGIPVVVALNKSDLTKKKKTDIDIKELSKFLCCDVCQTISSSNKDNGLSHLIETAIKAKDKVQEAPIKIDLAENATKEEFDASDRKRYEVLKDILKEVETKSINNAKQNRQDKIDRIVADKWLGIPIFAFIMWIVFAISQTYVGTFLADILVGWIDQLYVIVESALGENVSPVLASLLLDGIIGGVGAVLGFLPLIMVLFFLLALLEDCGYLARVAVVMDRFFKKVGLSGKSIIPMIIGTGCAIPGIMSTRTIRDDRQRRTTAMLTPFMPCGAKLPVIALFAGVFFNDAAWVSTSMYFFAIILIIISALIIRNITGEKYKRSYFIMELPEYKIPSLKRAIFSMFSRGKAFIVKAATIILLCNAIIQIMQTFNWSFEVVAEGAESTSILASIAHPFAIILIPLGFGVWQLAAAAITGFIAKENVVGTLAVVYGITNFINTDDLELVGNASSVADVIGLSSAAALAYLAFNLFTPPCFAAIGAMNAEMDSKKWLFGAIGFQLGVGYIVAFLIYQIGTLIETGAFGTGFVYGLIAVCAIVGYIVYLMKKGNDLAKSK